MRLSWFTGSQLLRRRAGRLGRRSAAAKLRVRQLERRRVLDAAAATVVVSVVASSESAPPPAVATTTDIPTQPPLTFNWTPPPGTESQMANGAEMADGAAVNTPPFLISQLDQNANEGQLLDLSGLDGAPPLALYIESDLGDTHTATVNWGDGSPTEIATVFEGVGSGALGGTHVYADEGTYTVTIVVMDNNGGMDSDTFDVFVAPVAPTATLGNSGPVVEGSPATVSFTNQFDPSSADTTAGFHYAYDINNDGTFDVGDGTYAGSGTGTSTNIAGNLLAEGPGNYTVKARIIDKDGQFTDYTTTIHVNNAAPTLTNITGDTINENGVATIGATIVDPSTSDVFSVQVDWLDGSTATIAGLGAANASGLVGSTTYQWDGSTRSLQLSHQYLDDGPTTAPVDTYNVSLTVSDDDLDSSGPYVAPVIVNNVPPFLISQLNQDVNEGQLLDLSGLSGAPPLALFIDPGTLDTHTATVDWGDGSPVENATVFVGMGSGAIGGTHVYADDGQYKVTVTVTDKDGESDTESFMVQVSTVVPTLIVPGPQMVEEGSPLTITNIGSITDPGFDNPDNPNEPPSGSVETFTYWINWGDGNIDTGSATIDDVGAPFDLTDASFDGAHTYANDGPYTITVRIADDNMTGNFVGGVNTVDYVEQTIAVTVKNDVPELVDVTGSTIQENGIATVSATIVDAGSQDVFSVDVNWQDGTSDTITGLGNSDVSNTIGGTTYVWIAATQQLQLSHQYLDDGASPGNNTTQDDYGVTLLVHDESDTGVQQTATVTVQNVAPSVALDSVSTINENGTATLTGSYTDIGRLDGHTLTVDWNDPNNATDSTFTIPAIRDAAGVPTLAINDTFNSSTDAAVLTVTAINATTGQVSFSVQHQYLDDGLAPGNNTTSDISTISVIVADDDGQSGNNTTAVTVNNVTPSVALNSLADINENGVATVTGSYSDIGKLDGHTLTVDWDDSNIAADSTFAITSIQNAAGVATLSVGDTFNSSTDSAVLSITAIDVTTGQVSFSVQHQYLDDGLAPGNNTISDVSTIAVTIADDDAQSGSDTTTVTVLNVMPSVTLGSVADINENGVATVTGSYTDIGKLDAHTLTVNWADPNNAAASTFAISSIQNATGTATLAVGDTFNSSTDGGMLTITAINATTGQISFSVQHQYLDDGLAPGNITTSDVSTIGVTVADDDAQSGSNTASVTIRNVTPAVALNAVPNINENGMAMLTGSYTDIGRLDAHTLTVDWNDPNTAADSTFAVTAIQNAAGVATLSVGDTFNSSTDSAVLTITAINNATGQVSFSAQHQYLDDGLAPGNNTTSDISTIGVTVADDDAQSGNNTTTVTVNNVTPSLVLNAVPSINENGTATLTGSYTDIGKLDGHTLTIDWGDPNEADDATFAIPSIQNAAGMATLSVNDTFNSSTDGAILTITAIDTTTGQVSFSAQHQYLDDGLAPGNNTTSDISTIGVTVADDDAQSDNSTTTVTVNNVTPGVALNAVPDINENGVATLTGSYTDIGKLDAHSLTVNWNDPNNAAASTFAISAIQNAAGVATLFVNDTFNSSTDGAVLTITAIDATTGQVSFSVQHQYLDDGLALGNNTTSDVSTIGVTVADDDAQSDNSTTTVTVNNVTPGVALNAVSDINENGVATLTGSYTDIGRLDAHTMTINWADANDGDASTFAIPAIQNAAGVVTLAVGDTFASSTDGSVLTITTINNATGQVSFSVQHQYLDDGPAPGNGTTSDVSIIGVTVADDDAQNGSNTTTVTVHNVAPVFQDVVGDSIDEGDVATVSMNFSDPGQLDVFTANVDWRDGSTATITGLGSVDVSGVVGNTSYEWTAATRVLTVSHLYADNANYQVVVRVADDDMAANFAGVAGAGNFTAVTTSVNVANVPPTLAGTTSLIVNEGSPLTLNGLGVHLEDVGFDNPANQTPPPFGDQFQETFTSYTIDWGDGTSDTPVDVVMRTSGSAGVPTTALFDHAAHTYADNGVYTVRVRVADDNMSGNFTTGTNGVDYVDLEFTITVANVAPTLAAPAPSAAIINENGSVNFTVSFTDPGFDNAANDNTPPNGGEVAETFTYDIDWGDGRHTVSNVAVGATPGGVGVPSAGSFGENHIYADDGNYTVTVKIHDDDGGVATQTFVVSVQNTNPVIVTPLNGDDVSAQGITRIRFAFSDLGFDNPANQTPPPNGDQFAETFTYVVDWGDGTVDTITVSQVSPGSPLVVNSQTMVLSSARTSGSEGVSTTGSFEVEHKYNGPPDPLHPAADIVITVTLIDDNGGTASDTIAIGNPGIDVVNVAIDTTPDVPRLEYVPQQMVQVLLDRTTTTPQTLQTLNTRVASSELTLTSDRYLELNVISPEGKVVAQYRLKDEALTDLRGLIATLPDGHYKIYLVRTDNNSRRLVLDVNVRQGRVVDPSDDSEGTRDRPPIEGGEQNQAQPLENNPQLQRVQEQNPPAAMNESTIDDVTPVVAVEGPSSSRLRWAAPLAGLGLVAQRGSWSREVGAAFDKADEQAWQRLRRAGRRRLVK